MIYILIKIQKLTYASSVCYHDEKRLFTGSYPGIIQGSGASLRKTDLRGRALISSVSSSGKCSII